MKRNYSAFSLMAALLLFAGVLLFSCTKDNNPPYVGNWVMYGNSNNGDSVYLTKSLLTLNVSYFSFLMQIRSNATGDWINYMGQTGYLAVTGNVVKVHFTSLGVAPFSQLTGLPSGAINYYNEGDSIFNVLLDNMGGHQEISGNYSISGNELTLKMDTNANDSDNDPGETSIYIRN